MPRPWWEENGFMTEWECRRHQMRQGRLADAQLAAILEKHGEPARAELRMLAGSGNFSGYAAALERGLLVPFKQPAATEPRPTSGDGQMSMFE
jgi:hypothetical protein